MVLFYYGVHRNHIGVVQAGHGIATTKAFNRLRIIVVALQKDFDDDERRDLVYPRKTAPYPHEQSLPVLHICPQGGVDEFHGPRTQVYLWVSVGQFMCRSVTIRSRQTQRNKAQQEG